MTLTSFSFFFLYFSQQAVKKLILEVGAEIRPLCVCVSCALHRAITPPESRTSTAARVEKSRWHTFGFCAVAGDVQSRDSVISPRGEAFKGQVQGLHPFVKANLHLLTGQEKLGSESLGWKV